MIYIAFCGCQSKWRLKYGDMRHQMVTFVKLSHFYYDNGSAVAVRCSCRCHCERGRGGCRTGGRSAGCARANRSQFAVSRYSSSLELTV